MKKYIILLFLLPILSTAQVDSNRYNLFDKLYLKEISNSIKLINPDKLSIGLKIGSVYDVDFSNLDIDQWSTDLSGSSSGSIPYSYLISLDYDVSSSLSIGVNYGKGHIYGENDIMYYNGDFSQYNLSSRLNMFTIKDILSFYTHAGIGIINSTSSRSFIFDDVVFLESETESIKTDLGIGVKYDYNDRISFNLERSYNRVADDGFDGWDDGTGNDKFVYTSLGISYRLSNNKGSSVDSLITRIEKFNDECFDCDELEERISSLEFSIDSLEERLSSFNEEDTSIFTDNNINNNYDYLIERLRLLEIQIEKLEDKMKENLDLGLAKNITEELKELLFYPSDIDTINISAYPRLDSLITFLHRYPNWEVLIVGYTDTDNTIVYNIDLSKRRASKVRDYLKLKGVQNKMTIQFKGELSPFAPNTSLSNKQLNRRTEVILFREY